MGPEKATSNLDKHSIDFADPVGTFEDVWALTLKEDIESDEQRYVTLGADFYGPFPIQPFDSAQSDPCRTERSRSQTTIFSILD